MSAYSGEPMLARIHAIKPKLHPAEKRLADFLSDFPGELASYDAQELAKLANVSKATVSRFVRRIGYANYEAARKHAREESLSGSRIYLAHARSKDAEASLDLGMIEERANLNRTFRDISARELEAISAAVTSAHKVWVIGQRINYSFAAYLYWQLTKVVPSIQIAPGPGETLGEHIASIAEDDVVICFAVRRRMSGTSRMIDEIARIGARIVLVSDEGLENNERAEWHLKCHTRTSSPQFEHTSVIALCHQLVIRATLKSDASARERLRRIDEINERLASFS